MKITSGIYKNRKILINVKKGQTLMYRPTAARTRLAIFNIIQNSKFIPENFLQNAIVADICCGSGAFGLEAISRGANKVYFVDKSPEQINTVKENVSRLKEEGKAVFILADAQVLPAIKESCRIVFIDPPYHSGVLNNSLESIIKQGWLEGEHIIIVELSKKDKIILSSKFEILDTRVYGKTKLLFLHLVNL